MPEYYQPKYIGQGIYHIYEPGNVYTSLIIGENRAMLIDTGFGFGDLKQTVEKLTALPLMVVNTHGHFDHAGGNFQFDNVYLPYGETAIYERYMETVRPVTLNNFLKQDARLGTHVIPEDFDVADFLRKSAVQPKAFVENHMRFDLGGRVVEALVMPGHTKHHIVYFDSKSRILFGGDDISNNVWLQFDFSVSLHEYAENLRQAANYFGISGADGTEEAQTQIRILTSHSDVVFPQMLIPCILTAIAHVDEHSSRVFIHPRTGARSLMHTEHFSIEGVPEIKKIHIVYDKNNK